MKSHRCGDGRIRSFPTLNCSICQGEGSDFEAPEDTQTQRSNDEIPAEPRGSA